MMTKHTRRVGVGLVAGVAALAVGPGTSVAHADPHPAAPEPRDWQPRQVVAEDGVPPGDILYPDYYRVVIGPNGGATAVWLQPRQPEELLLSHREPGSEWSEPITVDVNPRQLSDVVVDGRGHVSILWDRYVPAQEAWRSLVRTWRPNEGLGPTTNLGRGEGVGQLATNERGDLMATYGRTTSAFRPAGGQWQARQTLAGGSWTLAMGGSGRTYAVADRNGRIRMTAFRPGVNRWRELWTVADLGIGYANPTIAANEAGDLVIGWVHIDTDDDTYERIGAKAVYRPAGGGFGRIHQLFKNADGHTEAGEVAVGVDRRGIAHVAWVRPTDYFSGPLYAARHKVDGGWSKSALLARNVEDESVVLSANRRGDVLVTGVHAGDPRRMFAVQRPAAEPYDEPVGLSGTRTKVRAGSDLAANGAAVALYSPMGGRQIYSRSFTG